MSRVGSALVYRVLRYASIYIALPSACYRQICGQPGFEVAKARCAKKSPGAAVADPSKTVLSRHRIYYSRPSGTASGLDDHGTSCESRRTLHLLTIYLDPFACPNSHNHSIKAAACAALQHVFWSQHGLEPPDVFRPLPQRQRDTIQQDVHMRTPKRLHAMLPYLKQSIEQHRSFDYQTVLNKTCPSTVSERVPNFHCHTDLEDVCS